MQLWCIWPKADVHQEEKTLLWNIHKFSSLFPFKAPLKWIMREDNLSKAFKRVFNLKQHCCWPHYYKTRATMGTEPIKTRLISLMHLTLTQCFKINTKVTSKLWKIMRLFRMVFVHCGLSAVALKIDFIWKFRVTMVTLLENRKKNAMPHLSILKDIETFSKSFSIVQTDMKSFLSSWGIFFFSLIAWLNDVSVIAR